MGIGIMQNFSLELMELILQNKSRSIDGIWYKILFLIGIKFVGL